jgi:hypothetical protein
MDDVKNCDNIELHKTAEIVKDYNLMIGFLNLYFKLGLLQTAQNGKY